LKLDALEHEWLEKACIKSYRWLFHAFSYYGCRFTGDSFTLHRREFMHFLHDCGLQSVARKGGIDFATIFLLANIEDAAAGDSKQQHQNQVNPDKGLMRFEFICALIHVAKRMAAHGDVSSAFDNLCETMILRNLPAVALMDHDPWRLRRLYTPQVNDVFQQHVKELRALYSHFTTYTYEHSGSGGKVVHHFSRAHGNTTELRGTHDAGQSADATKKKKKKKKGKGKSSRKKGKKKKQRRFMSRLLDMQSWIRLLKTCELIGGHWRLQERAAQHLFIMSKMGCIEEVENRYLYTHMNFFDFLEGLAHC